MTGSRVGEEKKEEYALRLPLFFHLHPKMSVIPISTENQRFLGLEESFFILSYDSYFKFAKIFSTLSLASPSSISELGL